MIKKIVDSIKNPSKLITFFVRRGHLRFISDEKYAKIHYKAYHKKKLNLTNPITFSEKIYWLKVFDTKPEYTVMTDKYLARDYVNDIIGEDLSVPLIGVYEKFSDIPFNQLPEKFVIKCSHDSGSTKICTNKKLFDYKKSKKYYDNRLKINYYWISRERNYSNIKPRILIEEYLVDETKGDLKDYKFFTFDGVVRFIQVDIGRFSEHFRQFYSLDWEMINLKCDYPNNPSLKIEKPLKLKKMIEIASVLSKNIPHLRVDFYSIFDKIYFGELTFHHSGGDAQFTPQEYDKKMGEWIILPNLEK